MIDGDRAIADRLRRFLLIAAIIAAAGTLIELWLTDHTGSLVQSLALALAALVCGSCLMALLVRRRAALLFHRALMITVVAGSIYGGYEHVAHNFAFEREIRPSAAGSAVLLAALRGASPLMAPGALTLAAILALAGTYGDPVLATHSSESKQPRINAASAGGNNPQIPQMTQIRD